MKLPLWIFKVSQKSTFDLWNQVNALDTTAGKKRFLLLYWSKSKLQLKNNASLSHYMILNLIFFFYWTLEQYHSSVLFRKGNLIPDDKEFNSGCLSHFKRITTKSILVQSSVTSTRIYFEISHGKSKSDELEIIRKLHASYDACCAGTTLVQ